MMNLAKLDDCISILDRLDARLDAFEEKDHPRSSDGKFGSGNEAELQKPKNKGTVHNGVFDLKAGGFKPKGRGAGNSATEAAQVAWFTAKRDGKPVTAVPTGRGWVILRERDSIPYGNPHLTVMPDGKVHKFKSEVSS